MHNILFRRAEQTLCLSAVLFVFLISYSYTVFYLLHGESNVILILRTERIATAL